MKRYIALAALILVLAFTAAFPAALQIDMLLSQVRTNSGGSLAGGHVHFYSPGGTTNKAIWTDYAKTSSAANPYTLSSNGTALLYGDGLYRIVIHTSTNVTAYDFDNVRYEDISGAVTRITSLTGNGTGNISGFDNLILTGDIAGDNTGRIKDFSFGNANYTDNGYFGDIITKGPWVDVRAYSTLALALTAAANKTLLVASTVAISDNTTIPDNVAVLVLRGGSFAISSNKVLTISGPFEAGLYQAFSGAGDVSFSYASSVYVPPEWFGAVGDDSITDDTTAFQKTLNSVHPSQALMMTSLYRINGNLTFGAGGRYSLRMKGMNKRYTGIRYYGTGAMLTVSSDIETTLPLVFENFQALDKVNNAGSIAFKFADDNHQYVEFKNMDIQGWTSAGIEKPGDVGSLYEDTNISVKGGIGINYTTFPVTVMQITRCTFNGVGGASDNSQAIRAYTTQGESYIKDSAFQSFHSTKPIIEFFGTQTVLSFKFSGNYFEDNKYQTAYFHIDNSALNLEFSNNYVNVPTTNKPGYVLNVTGANRMFVHSNSFYQAAPTSAWIKTSGSTYIYLMSNYYEGGTRLETTDNTVTNAYYIMDAIGVAGPPVIVNAPSAKTDVCLSSPRTIAFDNSYTYWCYSDNNWRRVAYDNTW